MRRFVLHCTGIFFACSCFFSGPSMAAISMSPESPPAATITYSHMSNAGPLNPHLYSPNQMYAQEMLYEPLVIFGENGVIEPCLAESWEVSPDGLTYTFTLRREVVFSDGQPFDAHAVVANFDAILKNSRRHEWVPVTGMIESYRADGDHVFILELKGPYYPTLSDLALPRPYRFLSPAAFGAGSTTHQGITAPIGTGPWRLVSSSLGEYDLFERNPDYWGKAAMAERVLVKVVPDPLSRAVALETGEIDVIYGMGQITYDTFKVFEKNPAYATAVSPPRGTMAVAVNSNRAPTNDLLVRQALQHAVDKSTLIQGVFLGTQEQADTLFPPSVPYADIGLAPYAFAPAKAAQLLDDAGWTLVPGKKVREQNGVPLAIDFHFVGNDAAQKAIAEVLQAQCAVAGIFLNLVSEEEDAFFKSQREGAFGMIINSTWGPPFEPHAMVGSMRQPSHADYQAQLGLPMKEEIDSDINAVLATTDEASRRALYTKILTTLHEQAVYLPLCYTSLLEAHKKDTLGNVVFAPGRTRVPFETFIPASR